MKYLFRSIVFIALSFLILKSNAQTSSTLPITADSLATGNYKDVFKSFFQLSFERLISSQKEIQFTANPYAVMTKMNPDLLVDTNYVKYKHLRNLNFAFGGKLDASYKFNGFTSSVKYALVNKRDETVSRAFVQLAAQSNKEQAILNDRLNAYISKIPSGPQRSAIRGQINGMFSGALELGQLDTALQRVVRDSISDLNIGFDTKLNLRRLSERTYDSIKTLFQNRPLWTIGISDTTYQDQFFFSNLTFSTEFVKGVINPSAMGNLELNLKSYLQLADDSLKAGRDLKRSVFSFEPGLNFVLKVKGTQQSVLEFKLSGSYYHTFTALYADEQRDRLTMNGTLRFRVFNDIWVPLEIKYDPHTGNVFGFLNVRANFNGLGKTLAKK